MARLTKWDAVRGCYVIVPDSTQNHIQRLGELEDRDEAKEPKKVDGHTFCPNCKTEEITGWDFYDEAPILFNFCPYCGQSLDWSEEEQ